MSVTSFPESRRAWARLKINLQDAVSALRSGMSLKLIGWAMDVAPEPEKTSLAVAIHGHIVRTMGTAEGTQK